MVSVGQTDLLANKRRKFILNSHISKNASNSVDFQWSPFPIEMDGVSAVIPSPSGQKLLLVKNSEDDSPTKLEIWGPCQLENEIHVAQSVHGSLYVDEWFEGISWNQEETCVAYVAEEPPQPKPEFNDSGYKKAGSSEKDCKSWKGKGDWEETWGETYSKKRIPALFVVNILSGEARAVKGIPRSLSVGQVVWTPSSPCALYAVPDPFMEEADKPLINISKGEATSIIKLTSELSSAFFPRFSPDGKYLVFVSAKSAVDSGAHNATNSMHKINWPAEGNLEGLGVTDVVPVVMCPQDGCFPGLYCFGIHRNPWLSDGQTMILSSVWGSREVIISVNVVSCEVLRISPQDSDYSWNVLALDKDNILAVSSSLITTPQIYYGFEVSQTGKLCQWKWQEISTPFLKLSDKIDSILAEHNFSILKIPISNASDKIPISNASDKLTDGAKLPIEAIFVSWKDSATRPTIVVLHGGPHSVYPSSYSKSLAFLFSQGYNLLVVNYRGSLGFGEEALQSLPGHIGSQDVSDVLMALDYVIKKGLIDASRVAVVGGSHGGFLTTHLIGQAPGTFAAAAARNPVCNLSLMVGTTDIPDWCFVEIYGKEGKNYFSESPPVDVLCQFHQKSPISHISKVLTPTLFLLGAQDLRVPVSNGLQYARALKERGVETKIIVFPEDIHGLDKPQSDFESFLNIGVWFKKHLNNEQ
ncbi:hypothetical protein GUJ93_ZPchr0012g20436 [Zizania palustris]|uniref:acylaminoacyl-peptidase n=1 Tax=Zizania palustris TaxID=103762 RepID=A0A8J5WH77_ZIZPA|nr:hypothetical protein GUJ93_ZPchr0012g20436 [Zizania palustris]